jgi:coenzyme F420-reducing hydrogenase gamma subunit
MSGRGRPRLAVWKFASCDGCQLSLLSCEDELLPLAGQVEIAYFLEASRKAGRGPYDLSLVEGSITTPHDAERIQHVRRISKYLVTIGACATAGGIQALRNFKDVKSFWQPSTRDRNTSRPWRHRHRSPSTSLSISNCRDARSTSTSCSR